MPMYLVRSPAGRMDGVLGLLVSGADEASARRAAAVLLPEEPALARWAVNLHAQAEPPALSRGVVFQHDDRLSDHAAGWPTTEFGQVVAAAFNQLRAGG